MSTDVKTTAKQGVKCTPIGRLSFHSLFTPADDYSGTHKIYRATMIFSKDTDLTPLRNTCELKLTSYLNKSGRVINSIKHENNELIVTTNRDSKPLVFKLPFKDGNTQLDPDGNPRPEYKDSIFISFKTKAKNSIFIIDNKRNPITNEHLVYSGCYGIIGFDTYCYGIKDGRATPPQGVSFALCGFQKIKNGVMFTSKIQPDMMQSYPDEDDDQTMGAYGSDIIVGASTDNSDMV